MTEVQTLIRDPYAIYARRILRLQPLDPLHQEPDAPTRGIVMHKIAEKFVQTPLPEDPELARSLLMDIADDTLSTEVAWPAARRIWRVRLEKIADWLVSGEFERQAQARPLGQERSGALFIPGIETTLRGKVDRIDQFENGHLRVIDYKTGSPPSKDQRLHFDKQLILSALLAEQGVLDGVHANPVLETAYIGLGVAPKFDTVPVEHGETSVALAELTELLAAYLSDSRGYTSRRAVDLRGYAAAYDHLARYGEWDESHSPTAIELDR